MIAMAKEHDDGKRVGIGAFIDGEGIDQGDVGWRGKRWRRFPLRQIPSPDRSGHFVSRERYLGGEPDLMICLVVEPKRPQEVVVTTEHGRETWREKMEWEGFCVRSLWDFECGTKDKRYILIYPNKET